MIVDIMIINTERDRIIKSVSIVWLLLLYGYYVCYVYSVLLYTTVLGSFDISSFGVLLVYSFIVVVL